MQTVIPSQPSEDASLPVAAIEAARGERLRTPSRFCLPPILRRWLVSTNARSPFGELSTKGRNLSDLDVRSSTGARTW